MHPTTRRVVDLFRERGGSRYGHEAVTQLGHALQSAWLAESQGAGAELIAAALLHDVGHLLHELPADAPDHGVDDRHEELGRRWLEAHFPVSVVEPVRLHVEAKRYLCAVEPSYLGLLSSPSVQSLALQGGPMSAEEVRAFEANPYYRAAVTVRRWDDEAKDPTLEPPGVEHFAQYLDRVLGRHAPAGGGA
jgi:phosphonate degradation associated HDIG domain protein